MMIMVVIIMKIMIIRSITTFLFKLLSIPGRELDTNEVPYYMPILASKLYLLWIKIGIQMCKIVVTQPV
jgi:hypothetical protein